MSKERHSSDHVPTGVWIFWGIFITAFVIGASAFLLRDYSDRWLFIQTVVLTLTLLGVGIYTFLTWRMQQASQRQLELSREQANSYKLSVAADWVLKLDDQFGGKDLTKARYIVAAFILDIQEDQTLKLTYTDVFDSRRARMLDALEEIWDFFETVGALLRRGVLDDELVYVALFHWVNGYWNVGKEVFEERKKEEGEIWVDFERLYHRLCKLEEKENVDSKDLQWSEERQNKFLQQEKSANFPITVMP